MLSKLNTVIGLRILWYPGAEPNWIDQDFIGKEHVSGVVKYVGGVTGKQGDWAGIQLETPQGEHSGLARGRQYFTCPAKHGIFTEFHKLVKICNPRRSKDKYSSGNQSTADESLFVPDARAKPVEPTVEPKFINNAQNGFEGYCDWSTKSFHRPQVLGREKQPSS